MKEKIKNIREIYNFKIQPIKKRENDNVRLGMTQMINILSGYEQFDGYEIETDKQKYYVLIENGQSCCENWGYISSNDNLSDYIGKYLTEVSLVDKALDTINIDNLYVEDNQIQFVNFKFDDGDILQLAVYNSHNGYYGHSILVANDNEIMLSEVL